MRAVVLRDGQSERNLLSDTHDDERKAECGTRGMEKATEMDNSREEERKSRRWNEKVYTHHLCIKGVAVLALTSQNTSV